MLNSKSLENLVNFPNAKSVNCTDILVTGAITNHDVSNVVKITLRMIAPNLVTHLPNAYYVPAPIPPITKAALPSKNKKKSYFKKRPAPIINIAVSNGPPPPGGQHNVRFSTYQTEKPCGSNKKSQQL